MKILLRFSTDVWSLLVETERRDGNFALSAPSFTCIYSFFHFISNFYNRQSFEGEKNVIKCSQAFLRSIILDENRQQEWQSFHKTSNSIKIVNIFIIKLFQYLDFDAIASSLSSWCRRQATNCINNTDARSGGVFSFEYKVRGKL